MNNYHPESQIKKKKKGKKQSLLGDDEIESISCDSKIEESTLVLTKQKKRKRSGDRGELISPPLTTESS